MSNDLNQYYLQQMGIQLWEERPVNSAEITLSQLQREASSCTDCGLHKNRSKSVFGRGNMTARLMIIGDAPGNEEDQEGKPFAGKAGALLNRMLSCIGLGEDDVYMANVLKCKSSSDHPSEDEINACSRYLHAQIATIAPDIILILGALAGQFIIKTRDSFNTLRSNKLHYYGQIPCVISFHPDHLLSSPLDKKTAYHDWLEVKKLLSDRL